VADFVEKEHLLRAGLQRLQARHARLGLDGKGWMEGEWAAHGAAPVTVLLDVDGVLADFTGKCLPLLRVLHENPRLQREDLHTWTLTDGLPPAKVERFYAHCNSEGWCRDLEVLEEGRALWQWLVSLGVKVVFATAPMRGRTWRADRAMWLMDKGFLVEPSDLRFSSKKWELPGEILIDDRVDTVLQFARSRRESGQAGGGGVLFPTLQNRFVSAEVLDEVRSMEQGFDWHRPRAYGFYRSVQGIQPDTAYRDGLLKALLSLCPALSEEEEGSE
jgi:5'(3')-deoxyribonucleotidase